MYKKREKAEWKNVQDKIKDKIYQNWLVSRKVHQLIQNKKELSSIHALFSVLKHVQVFESQEILKGIKKKRERESANAQKCTRVAQTITVIV